MKTRKLILAVVSIITLSSIISCKKDMQNKVPIKKSSYQTTSRIALKETLLENFNLAKVLHNGLLELEYSSIQDGLLTTKDTTGLFYLANNYFITQGNFSTEEFTYLKNGINGIIDTSNNLQQSLEAYFSNDTATKNIYTWIINQSENWTISPSNFEQKMKNKLAEIDSNNTISNENKNAYSLILGASAGSYDYWKQNIENWRQLLAPNTDTSICARKWVDFFLRDCAGATWGTIYGSAIPLLGTTAGAIGGAAIISALEAQSW